MAEITALMIGCGTVGTATARLLVENSRFHNVIVADRDLQQADKLAELLDRRVTSLKLDCHQDEQLRNALSGVSVVLNTTGPFTRATLALIRTVVEAGIPYTDVNDDVGSLQAVFESEYLNSLARHRGVGVLPGLGASPGQTNVIASHMASRMDSVDDVEFFLVNDASYRSQAVWRHRLDLFGQPALLFESGRWTEIPAMSEFREVEFHPPWGTIRCYAVGLETVTIPQSFDGLLKASLWRGFSDPTTTETLKSLVDAGFASNEQILVDGTLVSPAELSAAVLAGQKLGIDGTESRRLPRQVRVRGIRDGRPAELTMNYSFPPGDIALATASCLVVGAGMLVARELSGPGVIAPEALDPAPFMWDMESRGVHFKLEDSASTRT